MTVPFMEGFEAVIDDSDLRLRGWTRNTTNALTVGTTTVGVPSLTGLPGVGLKLIGPYAAVSSEFPNQAGGPADFGTVDTGLTINQVWLAGGFSVYANLTFNSGTQIQVANSQIGQISFDGVATYWAIINIGTSAHVASSSDCVNWSSTTASPSNISVTGGVFLSIQGSGSTVTLVVCNSQSTATGTSSYSYSTNLGITWAQATLPALGSGTSVVAVGASFTGSSTTPYVLDVVGNGTLVSGLYTQASPTATPAKIIGTVFTPNASGDGYVRGKFIPEANCFAMVSYAGGTAVTSASTWYVVPSTADMTQATNYKAAAVLTGQRDLTFFNGNWYSCGNLGIFSAPPASTGPVTGPTAAWTAVLPTTAGTVFVQAMATNGTVLVAVGTDPANTSVGALWVSSNGTTWVKVNRFIRFTVGIAFQNIIWDGSKFILFSGTNGGIVATSTDGYEWFPIFVTDFTETASGVGGIFQMFNGTLSTSGGVAGVAALNPGGIAGVGFNVGPISSAVRTVSGVTNLLQGTANASQVIQVSASINISPLTHNYEIMFVSGATVNTFTIQYFIDSVAIGPPTTASVLAPTTDTTTHVLVCLPRYGTFTVIDDLVVSTKAGTTNIPPLGVANISRNLPSSDSQAQWMHGGSQVSNAAAVNQGSVSNASANAAANNFVTSDTIGNKDIYTMSSSVPATFTVTAVQVEANFTKASSAAPGVTVGVVSDASETDSSTTIINATSLASPTHVSIISEVDPATGLPWTNAGALASKVSITKTI